MKPRVVILGGGFGGLSCALALSSRRFRVTLVDQKPQFEFLPAIHELVSQQKKPGQLRLSLNALLTAKGHRFLKASVTSIDTAAQTVETTRSTVAYDYLVVALGAIDTDFGVPGVKQHGLGFKTVDQCAAIGKQLSSLVAEPSARRVTIVGAGFEGIEAAGEVLRRSRGSQVQLSLVDAAPHLLPSAPLPVSRHLEELCQAQGVHLHLGSTVAKVTPKTVVLGNGRRIRSDLTVWTGGAAPQSLYGDSKLADGTGWLPADETLTHREHENIFVVGDNASLPNPVAKQAYHALDMGAHCANNIKRVYGGRTPVRFKPSDKPQLISFGDIDTLLLHPNISLAGPSLGALKEAVYQLVLAQLDQRSAPSRVAGLAKRSTSLARTIRQLSSPHSSPIPAGVKRLG